MSRKLHSKCTTVQRCDTMKVISRPLKFIIITSLCLVPLILLAFFYESLQNYSVLFEPYGFKSFGFHHPNPTFEVESLTDLLQGRVSVGNIDDKNSMFPEHDAAQGFYDHVISSYLSYSQIGSQEQSQRVPCNPFQHSVKVSRWNKNLDVSLVEVRRYIFENHPDLKQYLESPDDANKSEEDIVEQQWFQFGGSSVWLEKEQCYLMVTRIMHSPTGYKNIPRTSLMWIRALDRNWEEIKGKNVSYLDQALFDVDAPVGDKEEFLGKRTSDSATNCELFKHNSSDYGSCVMKNATYPKLADIRFEIDKVYNGPEDPKVVLREYNGVEEPVIIFNMNVHKGEEQRRMMHAYLLHRATNNLIQFEIEDREPLKIEKNWAPFFARNHSNINFVYQYDPLEILTCSLDTGKCRTEYSEKEQSEREIGYIRGGTQYVPLPKVLPHIKDKQFWIGFPKLHIDACGCGDNFYRPMLSVLTRDSEGVYSREISSGAITFGLDVLSWDQKSSACGGSNVLSPNSISYWEVVGKDARTGKIDDHLALAMSESDSTSKVIVLRGVLDYILKMYVQEKMSDDPIACLSEQSKETCMVYGEKHQRDLSTD